MPFQNEAKIVRWKIHLNATPERVYDLVSTNDGRAAFWAESAMELDKHVNFIFQDGEKWRGRVLEARAPGVYKVEYVDHTTVTYKIDGDGAKGSIVTLVVDAVPEAEKAEWAARWVPVLLGLKAAAEFGIDLRNHDTRYTWEKGFADC